MKRKLIEVALPLEAINRESAREKSIRHGHPSTLHLWWARRPLAACRAVIFASLVDDPSSHPEQFPTPERQEAERQRLFRLIEELVKWENTTNEDVLEAAREEIRRSTDGNPPPLLDPFAGGGSIPLEAQRLGLEAHASDLNPVAVLINKALIEIPPKFADQPPVHPDARAGMGASGSWKGAAGLAEDIRRYGAWMRDEAERRIGHLYPKVTLPPEHGGGEATVIAWLWARTVKCPNPACGAEMPLVRSFDLSTRRGNEAHVRPVVDVGARKVTYEIERGRPQVSEGTVSRQGARCLVCHQPVPFFHIRLEGQSGRLKEQLMAIVADGPTGRTFVAPSQHQEDIALGVHADGPEELLFDWPGHINVVRYGLTRFGDLFTGRQLATVGTVVSLVADAAGDASTDAAASGLSPQDAADYGRAIATYLAFGIDRMINTLCTLARWTPARQQTVTAFARQAMPMTWDFPEVNPFAGAAGDIGVSIGGVVEAVRVLPAASGSSAEQRDATAPLPAGQRWLVSTDPPYYSNIGYADLSDFFYVWLRRSVGALWPELMGTVLTPKVDEMVALGERFGGTASAKQHFETGLRAAFSRMHASGSGDYPTTVYYAFKQAEADESGAGDVRLSTGWETMLASLLGAGFQIHGTWPMRSELSNRMLASGTNALASSIVLVCRPRPDDAGITDRKAFVSELRSELPEALRLLQHGNIAPVDLAQASIGPGMAVFSKYAKVVEPSGEPMAVRTALGLINQVLGEVLTEQEDDFDADTRWAITWFEQHRFGEGKYGDADVVARAKDVGVNGLVEAGIVESRAGKVRLLRSEELKPDWDPATDRRTPIWEITQRLIHALKEGGGAEAAADIVRRTGGRADVAKELAYRLYVTCERKNWADEARDFNSLVVEWPEITKLASGIGPGQTDLGLGG